MDSYEAFEALSDAISEMDITYKQSRLLSRLKNALADAHEREVEELEEKLKAAYERLASAKKLLENV